MIAGRRIAERPRGYPVFDQWLACTARNAAGYPSMARI